MGLHPALASEVRKRPSGAANCHFLNGTYHPIGLCTTRARGVLSHTLQSSDSPTQSSDVSPYDGVVQLDFMSVMKGHLRGPVLLTIEISIKDC
jgi:hypothetical protein